MPEFAIRWPRRPRLGGPRGRALPWSALPWPALPAWLPQSGRLAELGRLVESGWLPEPGRLARAWWLARAWRLARAWWLARACWLARGSRRPECWRLAWSCRPARAGGLPVRGGPGVGLFPLVGLGGKEQPRQPAYRGSSLAGLTRSVALAVLAVLVRVSGIARFGPRAFARFGPRALARCGWRADIGGQWHFLRSSSRYVSPIPSLPAGASYAATLAIHDFWRTGPWPATRARRPAKIMLTLTVVRWPSRIAGSASTFIVASCAHACLSWHLAKGRCCST